MDYGGEELPPDDFLERQPMHLSSPNHVFVTWHDVVTVYSFALKPQSPCHGDGRSALLDVTSR